MSSCATTSRTVAIGPSSTPENFTFTAAAQIRQIARAFQIVSRRPAREIDHARPSVTSDRLMSFFSSGAWARTLGSRQ